MTIKLIVMKKMVLCSLTSFVIASHAQAVTLATRYYCKDEAGGGISYDKGLDQFIGTRFKADFNFILSLDRNTNTDAGAPRYNVKITETGSTKSMPCFNYVVQGSVPFLTTSGILRCSSVLTDYFFNFSTNRYLRTYMYGYTDGIKDNSNTPSIMGGMCTGID